MDDLLIRGGHVIDGTGAPGFDADVSIGAGRIVAVERRSARTARRVIDARGQVVTPGLIDIHTHSDFTLPLNPRAESKIRQGVTLEVVGNCGFSLAPALPDRLGMLREYLAASAPSLPFGESSFTDYVRSFPPTSVNVILQVGHNTLRLMTAGMENRPLTSVEQAAMEVLLAEALAAGAWGLSSGLFTAPGCYADSAEILALAGVLRRHGAAYSSHIRDEADHVDDAVREAIAVAEVTGVHVQIAHLKLSGVDNWGGARRLLGEIAAARARGLAVDCDAYPYDTATNPLRNLLPRWVVEGGIPAMLERLGRAEVRKRIREDIARHGLTNFGRIPSWDVVRIALTPHQSQDAGRTLGEIARRWRVDPLDAVCDFLLADRGATRILITSMSEQDVHQITGTPWVTVGSDANALATSGVTSQGKPHPRSYGTHARLLGPFVRDLGLLSLPAAVHKTTGASAAALGLGDRGVLREGSWADVTVFEPARIADRATYDDPHQYAVGVATVLVNGEVVVDGCDHTGALPGRVLTRSPLDPLLTSEDSCKVGRLPTRLSVFPPIQTENAMTRRLLPGLLLGLTSLAWMIATPPLLSEAQAPKRGGTLRVSYGNEIANLDFHTAPGYEMMWVAMNVGCGLINITPDGKFVGDTAESWQVSPDGRLYTFKLRKNVLFHDGTPVDAAAVKFSIDRIRDPETKSGMRTFFEAVQSVEVVDPSTVQVHLKYPYAFFLHMLAAYRTGLVIYNPVATQAHTLEERKMGKPEAVSGCGPFRLVEWVKGNHLVMDRFDKYFEPGRPYLDRVVIRVIKDPVAEMAAFKAGEIDFIASFSPEHVDTMKAQNPRARIMTGKETTPMVAQMRVTVPKDGKPMSKDRAPHPVFSDIRVRKAVGCYGIDRREIVKIAFKGQATAWVGIIPPGTLDTVDVNQKCPYDPARAKALLAEAGYGPQKPLTFELMTNTEKSVFNIIATVIKEQMARIGVTANIRLVDKVTWMAAANQDGPWDMYVEDLLSLLTLDSNAFLSTTTAAWNHSRHMDTKVDEYYARYASEMDPAKRKAIAKEFAEFSADKLYWNTISGSPFYMVAQPWVKGYVYNAEFEVHWDNVWLDK